LPDFVDLTVKANPQTIIAGQNNNLTEQRLIFLDLINKKRAEFGAS
jgi:hypothetical protein